MNLNYNTSQPSYTIIKKPRTNSKRGAIQEAALKTFCHYGYEGASMSLIAAEAGVSKGIINKYFISKENLFKLCLSGFIEEMISKSEDSMASSESYAQYAESLRTMFIEYRPQFKLLLSTLITPNLAEMLRLNLAEQLENMRTLLINLGGEDERYYELNYIMYSIMVAHLIGGNDDNFERAYNKLMDALGQE